MLAANNAICMELQIFPPWLKKRREHRGQDTVVDLGSPAPSPPPPFCRPKQSCQSNILFHKEKQDISIPEWTPPLTQGSGSDIQGRRRTGNFLIDFCTQKVHVVYDTLKWRRRNMISKVKTEQFKRSSINRCLFQLI